MKIYRIDLVVLQLTEDGVNGACGQTAVVDVDLEFRADSDPAIIPHQPTGDASARDRLGRLDSAIQGDRVLVSN